MDPHKRRIWELDMLKGLALLLMIYYHTVYDLDVIFNYPIDASSFFNDLTAKASGSLFIFTAGVSSYLSKNNAKRVLRLAAIALGITAATYLVNPGMMITFGILHFLAVSILLGLLFSRFPSWLTLLFGVALIAASPTLLSLAAPSRWIYFLLGLAPGMAVSSDYYPLLPWFGIFLCGNAAGKGLYQRRQSLLSFVPPDNWLIWVGRHTLAVYLVHQPLIIGILYLIKLL